MGSQRFPFVQGLARSFKSSTVKKFYGMDAFHTASQVPSDHALSCLNVIVSNSGGLEKMRVPTALSPSIPNTATGPQFFFPYRVTSTGVQEVLAIFGNKIYNFVGDAMTAQLVNTDPLNIGQWDAVESSNLLFFCNARKNGKWNGGAIQNWGIVAPTVAPGGITNQQTFYGFPTPIATISRTANVTTVTTTLAFGYVTGQIVTIAGVIDVTFNAVNAVITGSGGAGSFTFANAGADSASNGGTVAFNTAQIQTLQRAANVVTVTWWVSQLNNILPGGGIPNLTITISGCTDGSFNGTFTLTSPTLSTNALTFAQSGPNFTVSHSGLGIINGLLQLTFGKQYGYAYRNSVTGEVSNMSPASISTGPQVNGVQSLTFTAPTDPQVNTIRTYATLDGGSDFFFDKDVAISPTNWVDWFPDTALNQAIRAQFINNPPPIGQYLSKAQSRIFISGGNVPSGVVAYTGYERIFDGLPESTNPPNNAIRLTDAVAITGHGPIAPNSLLMFAKGIKKEGVVDLMFTLRGTLEDITVSAPVSFSAFVEELPFRIGCGSHYTIAPTPYGTVWFASDLTVQLMVYGGAPVNIFATMAPILQTTNIAAQNNSRAAYFRWADKDWYALIFPTGSATIPNYGLIGDLNPDPNQNVGIFPFNVQAEAIGVLETSAGLRMLAISQLGKIMQFHTLSDTVNGISTNRFPGTTATLTAFWNSGYFGNEDPERWKMFRYARMSADQGGFSLAAQTVNDLTDSFQNPTQLQIGVGSVGEIGINYKSKRLSLNVIFPPQDVSCNLTELMVGSIPLSER